MPVVGPPSAAIAVPVEPGAISRTVSAVATCLMILSSRLMVSAA